MTTIAYDGKTIAADSLCSQGQERVPQPVQKIHVRDTMAGPRIFAFSGAVSMERAVIEWVNAGGDPEKQPGPGQGCEYEMIVIDRDGARSYTQHSPYPFDIDAPYCVGSGNKYAIAALTLGHSASVAVEVATRLDLYSGGHTQVVDVAAALAPAKPDTPAVTPEPSISDAEVDARVAALLAVANGASRPSPVPPMVHENIRAA